MIKKFILGLVVVLFTTSLYAGSAVIPNWRHNAITTYCLYVSNINNVNAEVNITLYKKDGTVYTGDYSSYGAQLNTSFVLNGNNTASLCLDKIPGAQNHGYGVINATPANDNGTVQLTAFAVDSDTANNNRWYSIPINMGMPF